MLLLELPPELLLLVSSYLEFTSDINALLRCHTRLYSLLNPEIYRLLKKDTGQALLWAAEAGNEICVRKLLDAGASFPDWDSIGEDPMTLAAKNGHVETVRVFLEHGSDPTPPIGDTYLKADSHPFMQRNPFAVAVLGGHESVVTLLMEHGAVKRSVNLSGDTLYDQALSLAAMGMHIPIMKILLAEGCNPNAMTSSRMVPLHYAARAPFTSTSIEVINLLVDAGAEPVDEKAMGTMSPLVYALSSGNESFAKFIMDNHGDSDILNQEFLRGSSPLLYALRIGNESFAKFIIERHGEFDVHQIVDMFIKSPRGANTMVSNLLQQLDFKEIEQVVESDPHAEGELVYGAVAGGLEGLMTLLLTRKESWSNERRLKRIVDLAAQFGRVGILDLLSRSGVPLYSASDIDGSLRSVLHEPWVPRHIFTVSPILLAIDAGHDEAVKYFIEIGCANSLAEKYGKGVILNRALVFGRLKLVQMIFGTLAPPIEDIAFADRGLSIQLAVVGGEDVFGFLLDQGVPLNPDLEAHRWAFAIAAMMGNVPILSMFLDAGFNLDMQLPYSYPLSDVFDQSQGGTLLAIAAAARDRNCASAAVDLLLKRGVQINRVIDSYDETMPLLCTISGGARRKILDILEFIQCRLKRRMGHRFRDWYSQDRDESRNLDVLATELLLRKGANPLLCNKSGQSALTIAARAGKINEVEMLLKHFDAEHLPFSHVTPHILAALANLEKSDGCVSSLVSLVHLMLPKQPKTPIKVVQKALSDYYWPKVYPCSN